MKRQPQGAGRPDRQHQEGNRQSQGLYREHRRDDIGLAQLVIRVVHTENSRPVDYAPRRMDEAKPKAARRSLQRKWSLENGLLPDVTCATTRSN